MRGQIPAVGASFWVGHLAELGRFGAKPMRKHAYVFASLVVLVAANANAKRNAREDPFAYEEREAERARDQEEQEEARPKQSFGNPWDFVVSAERLLGYAHTSRTIVLPGVPDDKANYDQIHLLSNPGDPGTNFSTPRLALDLFLTTGFSIGGAFGYAQDTDKATGKRRLVTLSPRFGYAVMFSEVVGIWPRVGATYQLHYSDAADTWLLAASADLPVVLNDGGHAAFMLGPRMDWAFLGKTFPEGGDSYKFKALEIGISAGISLFF
jgi:hypothetical protein